MLCSSSIVIVLENTVVSKPEPEMDIHRCIYCGVIQINRTRPKNRRGIMDKTVLYLSISIALLRA